VNKAPSEFEGALLCLVVIMATDAMLREKEFIQRSTDFIASKTPEELNSLRVLT
jgi:hypothetical protein